jgi:hypothetical protein
VSERLCDILGQAPSGISDYVAVAKKTRISVINENNCWTYDRLQKIETRKTIETRESRNEKDSKNENKAPKHGILGSSFLHKSNLMGQRVKLSSDFDFIIKFAEVFDISIIFSQR